MFGEVKWRRCELVVELYRQPVQERYQVPFPLEHVGGTVTVVMTAKVAIVTPCASSYSWIRTDPIPRTFCKLVGFMVFRESSNYRRSYYSPATSRASRVGYRATHSNAQRRSFS